MKSKGTLIAVKDMETSKRFYGELLGLPVVSDFGANVVLDGRIFLQTADSWTGFIHKGADEILFKNNAIELYFETEDMAAFVEKLERFQGVVYVHPLLEHSWGQQVVRFYDPDFHIIEVGEKMENVVQRFLDSGLTVEETAVRMDVPADYIRACTKEEA